jgi:hypothetical protein
MSMDMTPFREYAARLRKLADLVEDANSSMAELASAAHACGLELQIAFADAGRAVPMPVAAEQEAR